MKRLGLSIIMLFAAIVVFGQDTLQNHLRIQQILSEPTSDIKYKRISEEQIKYLLETDTTVRVTYKQNDLKQNQPAYYVNGLFVKNLSLSAIDPGTIEEISVEAGEFEKGNKKYSGKLFIKLKDYIDFKPITISEMKSKHLDLPYKNSVLMIDNKIVIDDYKELVINERGIFKIEVQSLQLENENWNVINLITRTEKNIKEAFVIRIGGDDQE